MAGFSISDTEAIVTTVAGSFIDSPKAIEALGRLLMMSKRGSRLSCINYTRATALEQTLRQPSDDRYDGVQRTPFLIMCSCELIGWSSCSLQSVPDKL